MLYSNKSWKQDALDMLLIQKIKQSNLLNSKYINNIVILYYI